MLQILQQQYAHSGADAATPHLHNRALGSTYQHMGAGATSHMAPSQPQQPQAQQQQHAGHGSTMHERGVNAGAPLQPWNGQSSNVWKPAWQQKAQQAIQERPVIADRSSGGSSGSGWKRAVRDSHQGQQESQPLMHQSGVQSTDTTLADAFGSGWGNNATYTKTHR